jgi:hypothetical protein
MTTVANPYAPSVPQSAPAAGGNSLRATLALIPLFARRRDGDRLAAALPLASFTIVTALLLTVIGGAQAFFRMDSDNAGFYQMLVVVALALLLVPLFTLGGSAAQLAARRRDDRLASLRLLGATTSTVSLLTIVEAAATALVGAMLGTVVYAALAPLVGLLRFDGVALGASMWVPWLWVPLTWLVVAMVAALSAAMGLRQVAVTPLGVRTRQRPRMTRARRAVIAVAIIAVSVTAMGQLTALGQMGGFLAVLLGVALAFAGGLFALDIIGPWVVKVRALFLLNRADNVERLVAARMILDDPKAAWRQVGGVAVTTFVGVIAGAGLAISNMAANTQETLLANDIRTGVLLTLAISFIMVTCTVAINQAATTLDRARVAVCLDRLGVPGSLLASASRRAVMTSLLTVVVGSAIVSGLLVAPLVGAAIFVQPVAVAVVAVVFVGGVLLVRLGASVAHGLVPGILARPDRVL